MIECMCEHDMAMIQQSEATTSQSVVMAEPADGDDAEHGKKKHHGKKKRKSTDLPYSFSPNLVEVMDNSVLDPRFYLTRVRQEDEASWKSAGINKTVQVSYSLSTVTQIFMSKIKHYSLAHACGVASIVLSLSLIVFRRLRLPVACTQSLCFSLSFFSLLSSLIRIPFFVSSCLSLFPVVVFLPLLPFSPSVTYP